MEQGAKQVVFYVYTGVGGKNVVFKRKYDEVSPAGKEEEAIVIPPINSQTETEDIMKRLDMEEAKERNRLQGAIEGKTADGEEENKEDAQALKQASHKSMDD